MKAYTIDTRDSAPALENMQQAIALELAMGCSLPETPGDWPVGLACAWNEAADAGIFDPCKTLGDMARAFLAFRLAKMGG